MDNSGAREIGMFEIENINNVKCRKKHRTPLYIQRKKQNKILLRHIAVKMEKFHTDSIDCYSQVKDCLA